jgi:hypothetical protein
VHCGAPAELLRQPTVECIGSAGTALGKIVTTNGLANTVRISLRSDRERGASAVGQFARRLPQGSANIATSRNRGNVLAGYFQGESGKSLELERWRRPLSQLLVALGKRRLQFDTEWR